MQTFPVIRREMTENEIQKFNGNENENTKAYFLKILYIILYIVFIINVVFIENENKNTKTYFLKVLYFILYISYFILKK